MHHEWLNHSPVEGQLFCSQVWQGRLLGIRMQ
jgi:hypothetical protein